MANGNVSCHHSWYGSINTGVFLLYTPHYTTSIHPTSIRATRDHITPLNHFWNRVVSGKCKFLWNRFIYIYNTLIKLMRSFVFQTYISILGRIVSYNAMCRRYVSVRMLCSNSKQHNSRANGKTINLNSNYTMPHIHRCI